jgi:hypothetical protein
MNKGIIKTIIGEKQWEISQVSPLPFRPVQLPAETELRSQPE